MRLVRFANAPNSGLPSKCRCYPNGYPLPSDSGVSRVGYTGTLARVEGYATN